MEWLVSCIVLVVLVPAMVSASHGMVSVSPSVVSCVGGASAHVGRCQSWNGTIPGVIPSVKARAVLVVALPW